MAKLRPDSKSIRMLRFKLVMKDFHHFSPLPDFFQARSICGGRPRLERMRKRYVMNPFNTYSI